MTYYRIRLNFRDKVFFGNTLPDIFTFVIDMQKLKYVWDIVTERELTAKQLVAVNEISKMISSGGEVKEIKQRVQQIEK